jgi:hypothetical protein
MGQPFQDRHSPLSVVVADAEEASVKKGEPQGFSVAAGIQR